MTLTTHKHQNMQPKKAMQCEHTCACTMGPARHAPRSLQCMHQGARSACTTGPAVHAPRGPQCMHHGARGACTTGPAVHAPRGPWCMPIMVKPMKYNHFTNFESAPRGPQCMHHGAAGAPTTVSVVYSKPGQRCMWHTCRLCTHHLADSACLTGTWKYGHK